MNAKALVLYSGGKDSSLVAHLLKMYGYDVTCATANAGIRPEITKSAKRAAKSLNFKHQVFAVPAWIYESASERAAYLGRAREAVNQVHHGVLEYAAKQFTGTFDLIADGCRREDKTPVVTMREARSLEDRYKIQYFSPLLGFSRHTIKYITANLFQIKTIRAGGGITAEYEHEIRALLEKRKRGLAEQIFPPFHEHTIVTGWRKNGKS